MVAKAMRDAKRKMPAERHDELLRQAVQISRTDGLGAVTLRKVATDLGVTPGLVSHYFSSAEQLITAAFRAAATEDLDTARKLMAAEPTAADGINALMDYTLDESSMEASALWLEAWSLGRTNPALAAEAATLTDQWLECIAEVVRAGDANGEFSVADSDVAARRLLTMIDGLGAQMVVRAVAPEELKHIARSYVASELHLPVSG
ncbi:TetR family transcriptional regulator C-terminal domain-containing protein [Mycobacterium sp. M26]|uniref:TetR/AcrR family transcriptional regulator n=1 Tax=Mycobacterium sp. M26 TaxID=1762962 RepID=UPI00073E5004|nr:TetR family transcriptional regulator C-terminal domain-containing protein [Mycobacterium sp. M26]